MLFFIKNLGTCQELRIQAENIFIEKREKTKKKKNMFSFKKHVPNNIRSKIQKMNNLQNQINKKQKSNNIL